MLNSAMVTDGNTFAEHLAAATSVPGPLNMTI
eukprot:SAG31_NODE_10024_length_1194_cov_1.210959_2_plen_31_part_01